MAKRPDFRSTFSVLLGIGLTLVATNSPLSAITASDQAHVTAAVDVQINEVCFKPSQGNYEWVELKNPGANAANVRGFRLTDEDNNFYRIPDALPEVPPSAFIVVIFDGLGSANDDYNFSDNVATLHSQAGLVNIFEDNADQVALYRLNDFIGVIYLPIIVRDFSPFNPVVPGPPAEPTPPALISFMAWGANPLADATTAVRAGAWGEGIYVGTDAIPGADSLLPDGSLGIYANQATDAVTNWIIYRPSETSQGVENRLPAPFFRNPVPGTTTTDHQITFGWFVAPNATGYRLEVDNDPAFSSPEVAVNVPDAQYQPPTPLSDGTFYYRAKALGALESTFSPVFSVTLVATSTLIAEASHVSPATSPGSVQAVQVLLGVTPALQHKDTMMLDLDGDTETGQARWDSAHETDGDATAGNGTPVRANNHDNLYCTRASISMIVAYHGGKLSQDRIAFYAYGGGAPEGDLGNGIGLWPNGDIRPGTTRGRQTFDWAMNGNAVTSSRGKPTFDQIKGFIDANRPMLVVEDNVTYLHSVVLDGYLDLPFFKFVHRIDPMTATGSWVLHSSWKIDEYHVPPASVTPRSDENADGDSIPDTIDDSENDGVSDFDERNRFNLNPINADTDGDRVNDKLDIREYVFDANGNYSLRGADADSDGQRKELDRDNDYANNTGSDDGCEDTNFDGKYQAATGETDNFNAADDIRLHIRLDWPLRGSDVDLHLIRPGGAIFSSDDTYFSNPGPDWGTPGNRCDDPRLDVDCITSCTVENIRLGKLENGTYQVKLHYYSDHGQGPTSPRVTLWYRGTQYNFGPRSISNDQVWDVATVSADGTVTPQNSMSYSRATIIRGLDHPGK